MATGVRPCQRSDLPQSRGRVIQQIQGAQIPPTGIRLTFEDPVTYGERRVRRVGDLGIGEEIKSASPVW